MASMPFYDIDDTEFSNEFIKHNKCANSNILNKLPRLNSFDTYIDLEKVDNLLESEEILLNNSLKPSEYFTVESFCKNYKNFEGLSFIHYNARSLGANMPKIRDNLNDLSLVFDIVAISETWTKREEIHYDLQNYTLYCTDRSIKSGGGVALYANNKLNCKGIKPLSIENEGLFELIRIELIIPNYKNKIVMCCYTTIFSC